MTVMNLEQLEAALLARVGRKARKAKLTIVEKPKYTEEQKLERGFAWFDFNSGMPVQDTSHRAKLLREVHRIATWYALCNVGSVLSRALDAADVSTPAHLGDDALDLLVEQLQAIESNIQTGCGPADAPPAS